MNSKTQIIKWILCTGLVLNPTYTSQQAQYECGSHGRFEYCVDGIPGCIIGCHCHPGYYFDSESKICEPNTKLTQQYRRNYLSDQVGHLTHLPEGNPTPTTTTNNPIDEKVEEITKDADELGDWLYNQFFKTIENQVINKTDRGDLLTRRSTQNMLTKKSKRKTRKSRKKYSKRKKNKKKGVMRNKLLRITEDDSLFDSTSNSGEYSSSGSGSYSSSGSSNDDSSSSFDFDGNKKKKEHDGHKKFIFYNKAKKPPLPSFIFLPNMGTPFYPPIGLPPPPLPMYPMVPVPPMGPIFPEFTVRCNDVETTSAGTPTTTTTKTTTTSETSTIVDKTKDTTDNKTDDTTSTIPPSSRKRGRKVHGHNKPWENRMDQGNMNDKYNEARNIFLRKLREEMKNKNKKQKINDFMEEIEDTPFLDYNIPPGESFQFIKPNTLLEQPSIPEETQNVEDVRFKYLSELIHRVDFNNTNMKPETQHTLSERIAGAPLEPQRRRYYNSTPSVNHSPPNIDGRRLLPKPVSPEDLYYTNLGRQIASLIRKIDSKSDRQVNIEIEHVKKIPVQPVFFENSYAPRSYWERSVRSPLKYHQSNKYQYSQKSNENLFDLESKVQIIATTKPTLSLHDLENIINTMDRTTSEIKSKIYNNKSEKSSNMSLNINLLPKIYEAESYNENFLQEKYHAEPEKNNDVNTSPAEYLKLNIQPKLKGIVINDIHTHHPQVYVRNGSTKIDLKVFNPNFKTIRRVSDTLKSNQIPRKQLNGNINKWYKQSTTKKPYINHRYNNYNQYLQNNQKTLNYYTNNNNQYMFEPALYPFAKKNGKYFVQPIKPSYFHREMNHFNFFD